MKEISIDDILGGSTKDKCIQVDIQLDMLIRNYFQYDTYVCFNTSIYNNKVIIRFYKKKIKKFLFWEQVYWENIGHYYDDETVGITISDKIIKHNPINQAAELKIKYQLYKDHEQLFLVLIEFLKDYKIDSKVILT